MITAIYAHKPGQGVTTIAAALATLIANAGRRTLLVDTSTDLPAVLGINEHPDQRGLADYLTDTTVTLSDIATPVTTNLDLITRADPAPVLNASTFGLLTGALDHYDTVIIDAGTTAPEWVRHSTARVLVTRPCYLALRHATGKRRPDYLAVITEPGRALNTADIEAAIGTPVTVTIGHAPDIRRAVDAGLLTMRLPRTLARALAPLLAAITTESVVAQ